MRHWNIVADIGGTNARFAVVDRSTETIALVTHYAVAEYDQFIDALQNFLQKVAESAAWSAYPDAACFALAGPVVGDRMKFTNSNWQIDKHEITSLLQGTAVSLINDFSAVGYAVSHLNAKDSIEICAGTAQPQAPIVVLGPGTGLGVGTIVPSSCGYEVLAGEGGHVDFAPVDKTDALIFDYLRDRHGRVSAERVLSGIGIETIYTVLSLKAGTNASLQTAVEISAAATNQSDRIAIETLQVFCRCLGSMAGNLALTVGAKGGVYIAGGIVPQFIEFFLASDFKQRYFAKGRVSPFLDGIPVRLIIREDVGLFGAAQKIKLATTNRTSSA